MDDSNNNAYSTGGTDLTAGTSTNTRAEVSQEQSQPFGVGVHGTYAVNGYPVPVVEGVPQEPEKTRTEEKESKAPSVRALVNSYLETLETYLVHVANRGPNPQLQAFVNEAFANVRLEKPKDALPMSVGFGLGAMLTVAASNSELLKQPEVLYSIGTEFMACLMECLWEPENTSVEA